MATSKGKKNAKVKWAIGSSEPDDLPDFQTNDDIVRKNKGALPPKGRTRVLIKKVTSKDNKNGDQMLTVTCEIAEKGSKKEQAFNGYAMWERLNVTEQGAPYLKRFLTAVGVTWNDFINKTVADTSDEKQAVINKIGKVKFGTDKPPEAWVSVKHGVDQNDEEVAEVGRFLPPPEDEDDDVDDEDVDGGDSEEDDDDIEVDDDDDDDDSDDEDDDDDDDEDDDDEEDEDDDAEETLRAELKALKVAALKKRAIRAGADEDDMPTKKGDLIDHIVELELSDEDDDDEDDDEDDEDEEDRPDPDELKAELKAEDLKTLRDRARANGRKASDLKGAKKPALIKMIVEDEIPPF